MARRGPWQALLLLLIGCGPAPFETPVVGEDAGPRADVGELESDAGTRDSAPDAAEPDAAVPDGEPADGPDARVPDAATPDGHLPDAFVEGDPVYTDDRLLSPITPRVAARLRGHLATNPAAQDDVFAKVGASSTVSRAFMHCFAGGGVDLAGRASIQEAIDFFGAGDAAGESPFTRDSESAVVGWSALSALAGDPSPLERELAAINPRFAVIMYGTNDIQRRNLDQYANNLWDMAELLLERGVIPIFSSIMPRDDDPQADDLVPSYNAVVRGIAQAHLVPFTDLHQPLLSLPNHGLAGDRLHSSAFPGGACVFTQDGLMHGYNWRNLLTIETLERLMRTVLDGDPAPDPPVASADPRQITRLPFTATDTTERGDRNLDAYPSCDTGQDESGPEHIYRFTVDRPTRIRAWVLDRGDADVDLHLLRDPTDPESCVARDDRELRLELEPGTWHIVLDTFVRSGTPRPGEYLLVIVED